MMHIYFFFSQHAAVTPWAPCPSPWLTAPSATPPMETASVNLEWVEPTVTDAWWDTGASMNMAAVRVIVQETVIRLLETVCSGEEICPDINTNTDQYIINTLLV